MIPKTRVLGKLDSLLQSNDTAGAKRLLEYWLGEAAADKDDGGKLLMLNELMGLCRKLGERDDAVKYAEEALFLVAVMGIEENIGAATTYLNSATVYKAFGEPENALHFYELAKEIYERDLAEDDERLGGLYNNMGLALVDLKRFSEANELYMNAVSVMEKLPDKEPEAAITYLNMADAARMEFSSAANGKIDGFVEKAIALMEAGKERTDGNYAFVCEKCASVFGYYGYEDYAKELSARSRRIYEGT
jgi:tetratricopeptide (TPR) repeat protein